jgi:hypothetical protein
LAKAHGWQKRRGKICAFEFLHSLVFGQSSSLALTLNAQAASLSQTVTRQAIDQRYTPAAVAFFKAAFAQGLQQTLEYQLDSPMSRLAAEGFRCHSPLRQHPLRVRACLVHALPRLRWRRGGGRPQSIVELRIWP